MRRARDVIRQWLRPLVVVALVAFISEAVFFLHSLFAGSLTYMGAGDAETTQAAWHTYQNALTDTWAALWVTASLTSLALALPAVPWIAERRTFWRAATAVLVARTLFIASACIRIPTLFSEVYSGPTWNSVMKHGCSIAGIVTIVIVSGVWVVWVSRRHLTSRVGYGLLLAGLTAILSWPETPLHLPAKSVVLLVADSLRADAFNARAMPETFALATAQHATVVKEVWPPLARTAPALTALLTGKLPEQSGVTTMFSPEATFDQRDSIVSAMNAAGVCTVVVTEYPGELFRKYDLGFTHVDAPMVRFRELSLQLLLTKNALVLATLSHAAIRRVANARLVELMHGLPIFADSTALFGRLARDVAACEGRPVFALVFADQPHFPYVQTWPHYLALPTDYDGPYLFSKDPLSNPRDEADKRRVRALYDTSLRASDRGFARMLGDQVAAGALSDVTFIITGDHGESLYDALGIMGHGDQLGESEGIAVPWVVLGRERERFAALAEGGPLLSVHLTRPLAESAGAAWPRTPALPADVLYVQTGEWLAQTPNVPSARVVYPALTRLLTVRTPNSHIVLGDEYVGVVEYAKHRRFVRAGERIDILPGARAVRCTQNDQSLSCSALPTYVSTLLRTYDAAIAPLLLE